MSLSTVLTFKSGPHCDYVTVTQRQTHTSGGTVHAAASEISQQHALKASKSR